MSPLERIRGPKSGQHVQHEANMSLVKIDEQISLHELGAIKNRYLGNTRRNPLTGRIDMIDVNFEKDWILTDLFKRGSSKVNFDQEFLLDKYYLKAKPHPMRTWLWQSIYKQATANNTLGQLTELGLLDAFATRLDESTNTYWSPLMLYLPLMPFVSFTLDPVLIMVSTVVMMVQMVIDATTNTYFLFKYSRFISFIPRCTYLVFVFIQFATFLSGEIFWISLLGYLTAILIILVDFYFGDYKQLLSKRDSAIIEVVHDFDNRNYIARWVGPAKDNPTYKIREDIIGVPESSQRSRFRHIMIMTVIQGIIVELEPLTPADYAWFRRKLIKAKTPEDITIPFYGIDLYDEVFLNAQRMLKYIKADPKEKIILQKQWAEEHRSKAALPAHLQKKGHMPLASDDIYLEEF